MQKYFRRDFSAKRSLLNLLQLSFIGSFSSSSRAQQRASFVIKSVVLEAKNMIRWQWGSSCSSAVEHMPAELNSWVLGFNSHRVLGFLLLLSSVMCPYTGSSKSISYKKLMPSCAAWGKTSIISTVRDLKNNYVTKFKSCCRDTNQRSISSHTIPLGAMVQWLEL